MNPANDKYIIQNECHVKVQHCHKWRYSLTDPAAAAADSVHADITMTAAAQPGVVADIIQPDFPRVLSVTGGHADQIGTVTIHGTDIDDNVITDAITMEGTATVPGAKAFKSVTSLDIPARSSANVPTVSIGLSAIFGMPLVLPTVDCIEDCTYGGAPEAVTLASVNADISKTFCAATSAPDAAHTIVFRGYIYTA